ncbi:MAG: 6-carboxytetrahydropterin synthase, partial [Myxococcota bacterium]
TDDRPTLFVRRFTVLDFARVGESGFEGESLYVDAELYGDLDDRGFLMDFGPVKKLLKRVVDEELDHRFAVPTHDPRVKVESAGDRIRVRVAPVLDYEAPAQAFALLPSVDDAAICEFLRERMLQCVPANVSDIRLRLQPEDGVNGRANFRYTHGLKLHDGNCQRLIHGHRNIIEVFLDGRVNTSAEKHLAELLHDIHFTNVDDLETARPLEQCFGSEQPVSISYESDQGRFRATFSERKLLALGSEPTIENIAGFARRWVAKELSVNEDRVTVRAYEGIHKGARAGRGFTT